MLGQHVGPSGHARTDSRSMAWRKRYRTVGLATKLVPSTASHSSGYAVMLADEPCSKPFLLPHPL